MSGFARAAEARRSQEAAMLCQSCHAAEATYRVATRSTSTKFTEAGYCEPRWRALADLPDPPPAGLHTLVDHRSGQSRVVSEAELLALALLLRLTGEK